MRTARTIAAMVFLLVSGIAAAAAQSDLQTFAREDLVLALRDGTRHTFVVEVATSREQKAQGLMFRPSLAPDAGMLFVYKSEGLRTMWMKNTLIPLDMLFIDRRAGDHLIGPAGHGRVGAERRDGRAARNSARRSRHSWRFRNRAVRVARRVGGGGP
jgi:hypothetical protein